ncbi:hypothetical protein EV421DRAFT_1964290 [Armillaria borealis]|uniref:Protein kinase domain-containing protein n=1 Tax=Armillaria borealis TaxID=47425 RepID=A0AA39JBY3_9AGAR|nr:hypothetical protein EV421DRAFT_1964290 [Armillaria borealis]
MGSGSSDTGEQRRISPETLLHGETFWHKHVTWLKECGYELRPRFQPGWVPSWTVMKKEPYECEDSSSGMRSYAFMDVKDTSTGQIVAMKIIMQENNPNELAIATFLTSEEKSSDRHNHCVPILRILPVPNEEGHAIIVMPYLRPWDSSLFTTTMLLIIVRGIEILLYRFRSFDPQTRRTAGYHTCIRGGDKSVPEFLADNPDWTKRTPKHDPFAVDIYYLGNAFRAFLPRGVGVDYKLSEEALRRMKGFESMEPLITAMTELDPAKRVKIDEAVGKFAQVEKSLSVMTLRSRVVYNTDFTILRPFKAVGHWVWTLGLIVRGIPAIPKRVPQ